MVVEQIISCGSECWQLPDKDKKQIEMVEMNYKIRVCRISNMEYVPNPEIKQ